MQSLKKSFKFNPATPQLEVDRPLAAPQVAPGGEELLLLGLRGCIIAV
jgi:hypothetical protein